MAENKQRAQMRSKSKAKAKPKRKKSAGKSKTSAAAKQSNKRNMSEKKVRAAKKKRATSSKEIRSLEPSALGRTFSRAERSPSRGRSAGQSGDAQALSRREIVDSESVEELLAEGQAREAAAVSGVEDALDPDQGELHTREVPEDDVPEEYTDKD